jgi:hypothetical protein
MNGLRFSGKSEGQPAQRTGSQDEAFCLSAGWGSRSTAHEQGEQFDMLAHGFKLETGTEGCCVSLIEESNGSTLAIIYRSMLIILEKFRSGTKYCREFDSGGQSALIKDSNTKTRPVYFGRER